MFFERFTDPARRVVVIAQSEARERCSGRIRPEHLLLGILQVPDGLGAELLRGNGVGPGVVDAALRGAGPGEALAALGIDLDEVRRRTDEAFGPGALDRVRGGPGRLRRTRAGHIPFDRAAKKSLELSLREAVRAGDRGIGTEHVLLGLLWPDHTAYRVLTEHGMTLPGTRRTIADRRGGGAQAV
ncbi:Clp protease N-terminal domain-containing protein [Pseudonocardia phyllosphaerae]|uniref:Clp protease N-terminal domain-containing protein n=1 Tax=Pseudonocardia phyllosphaerae TaxID=3390502 RepID=UPI00397A69EF